MAAERLERGRLLVLADEGEDDSAPRQPLNGALEVDERLAEPVVPAEAKVLPADVADDPAPQRIVEVEHEELPRPPGDCVEGPLNVARGLGEDVDVERDLAEVPGLRRRAALAGVGEPPAGVEDVHIRSRREPLHQPAVHDVERPREAPFTHVEQTGAPLVGWLRPGRDEDRAIGGRRPGQQVAEGVDLVQEGALLHSLVANHSCVRGDRCLGPRPDDGEVVVPGRRPAHQRLDDLPERRDLRVDAGAVGERAELAGELAGREVREDGPAMGDLTGLRPLVRAHGARLPTLLPAAQDARRNPPCDHTGRDLPRDDAPRGDDGPGADPGPREHRHADGEPHVVANHDLARCVVAHRRRAGELGVGDDAVVADHDAVADGHALPGGDERPEVDLRVVSDRDLPLRSGRQLRRHPPRRDAEVLANLDLAPRSG